MTTTPTITPSSVETIQKPVKVLWKWSFFITALVLAFLMWQCGSGLLQGRRSSNEAVRRFHEKLNAGEYELICQEAGEAFAGSATHEETVKLLQGVHAKLGSAGSEKLLNIGVNATTNGTFITARYNTQFTDGTAVETFTWIKSTGALKLFRYYVESSALLK